MTVVFNANAFKLGEKRSFPVHRLSDGTPCIIGTATKKASSTSDSLFVFSSGGHAKMHPLPETGKCLYEIHPGDFVEVYEVDRKSDVMAISNFSISQITQETAVGIPTIL